MEGLMKNFSRSSLISSIVLIVLGVLLIFQSEATIISISYIIGGVLILLGVLALLRFVKNSNKDAKSELDIIYGIVTIILGVLIINNPQAIASIIPFVLGISIIINSATKLQYAFELKANENNLWKATMFLSLISALCGIVLIFNPFKGAVVFTKIVGLFIILYSILDIISTLTINKNVSIIHSAIEGAVVDAEVIEEEEEISKPKTKKKNKKKQKSKGKNL